MPKLNKSNPVVEVYKGIVIRRYPKIELRLSPEALKMIIDTMEATNLTAAQVVGFSSKPCECCKGVHVKTINPDNSPVDVPRGILFQSALSKNGAYIKRKSTDDGQGA